MAGQSDRYNRVAALLHWLTALLVLMLIPLGIGGEAVGSKFGMTGLETIFLHKSLGITVFGLTLLRLVWRLGHKPPPLPASTPAWQRKAAHALHWLFYGFLLGLPATGYMLSSGSRFPLEWFGNELPKLPLAKSVSDLANDIHVAGGLTLTALVVVHIGAALWHQFVQRDRLLARMGLG